MITGANSEVDSFADDVLSGLSETPKHLSSRYFYDAEGSSLFLEMTRAETSIFKTHSVEICNAFLEFASGGIDIFELGAGDGAKTAILIERLLEMKARFSYLPIDISEEANDILVRRFARRFPNLRIAPQAGNYLEIH